MLLCPPFNYRPTVFDAFTFSPPSQFGGCGFHHWPKLQPVGGLRRHLFPTRLQGKCSLSTGHLFLHDPYHFISISVSFSLSLSRSMRRERERGRVWSVATRCRAVRAEGARCDGSSTEATTQVMILALDSIDFGHTHSHMQMHIMHLSHVSPRSSLSHSLIFLYFLLIYSHFFFFNGLRWTVPRPTILLPMGVWLGACGEGREASGESCSLPQTETFCCSINFTRSFATLHSTSCRIKSHTHIHMCILFTLFTYALVYSSGFRDMCSFA